MEPSRDNPLARFTAFWWGIGVISLFFFVLLIVRLVTGSDGDADPLEQAAAFARYDQREEIDAAQEELLDWKVVEADKTVQVPPSVVYESLGQQLVASKPAKVEEATQIVDPNKVVRDPNEAEIDFAKIDAMTPPAGTAPDPAVMELGKASFMICMACHGQNGEGGPIGPPLADSDWVAGPVSNLIRIQLRGLTGPITVSGKQYNFPAPMAPLAMQTDDQIAAVLTYIRNAFGNSAPPVLPEQVKALRSEVGKPMLTEADILPLK